MRYKPYVLAAAIVAAAPLPAFAGQNNYPGVPVSRPTPVMGDAMLTASPVGGRGPSYELVFARAPRDMTEIRITIAPVGGRGPSLEPQVVRPMQAARAARSS